MYFNVIHILEILEERLEKYKKRYWVAEEYYLKKLKPYELAHYIQKSI